MQAIMESIYDVSYHPQHPLCGNGRDDCGALLRSARNDRTLRWLWLAELLSFLFYFPVVLFADAQPIIGMMMLPKTCMYIWMMVMFLRLPKET